MTLSADRSETDHSTCTSRGEVIHRFYLFGLSGLLLLLLLVVIGIGIWSGTLDGIWSGTLDLEPNRPGLTIIPQGPVDSVPVGEIAGSLRLLYSGPRGSLDHSLESWIHGEQQLHSLGGAAIWGTGIKSEANFVLKHVVKDVELEAAYAEEELGTREPFEPTPTKKTILLSTYRLVRKVMGGTHDSFLWAVAEEDSLPPYRIVHAPRRHLPIASPPKPATEFYREQPVVWGCFFNREEDQEWMDIFTKVDWSDEDFEHAASHSDGAAIVRMWLDVDPEEDLNETRAAGSD